MSIRILICGDRFWQDKATIHKVVDSLPPDTVVIHGAARGADCIAGDCAMERGLKVIMFPAKWLQYGKAAGVIRNQQMLDEGHPNRVVFFHPNLSQSRGTKDMVERARKAGIPTYDGTQWAYSDHPL